MDVMLTGVERSGGTRESGALLNIRSQVDRDGALRVWLIGEVDMAVTDDLAPYLAGLAELEQPVRLDLSRLRFIDGHGLATVASALIQARAAGCEVEVDPVVTLAVELAVSLTGIGVTLWPDRADSELTRRDGRARSRWVRRSGLAG